MSENNTSAVEELAAKHKQERKELQGRIQALKKSVTKGDQKKKREIQEEIALLESNLDKKHEEESAVFSQRMPEADAENSQVLNNVDAPKNGQPRISKAQKRRDKKATASKEREVNIKEQEKLNVHGPRHKESAAISKFLKGQGLQLFSIPADGNCLYKAVEHQLERFNGVNPEFNLSKLRKLTADHLRANADYFLPFLTHPDTMDMLTPKQFEEYCHKVECTTAWGGQIELQALSNVLKRRIEVIQASGPPIILGNEFGSDKESLMVTYHHHMYRLGEHYNSVQPISDGDDVNTEFVSEEEQ